MVVGEVARTNGGDVTTVSSIALLQERFRQLQKMKELRQEQQLLKMLSETERHINNSPPFTHFHPKMQARARYLDTDQVIVFLPPAKPQLSLSLWPDLQTKNSTNSNIARSWFHQDQKQSWFYDSRMMKFDNSGSDVDTSLRL